MRTAAQQALEALTYVTRHFTRTPSTLKDSDARAMGHEAITALRAALAEEALQRLTDVHQEIEAAQEPVPKSTWQKLYEAAIDQRNKAVALNQELLEALKELTLERGMTDKARAAIAKAEGQA